MKEVKEGERLDYINKGRLQIIQSPSVFSFSIDAVLLARFASVPRTKGNIIDFCSGNGIIPLVLTERSQVPILGVEIQPLLCDMARRSVQINKKEKQVTIKQGDIITVAKEAGSAKFDLVTCNPPYFATKGEKEYNENPHLAIARHEIYCSLEEVIHACSQVVKQKGKVAMVHRPERLSEMITLFEKHRIAPKRVKFIHPKKDRDANIVLLEGIKDGKPGMACLPPLFVYDEKGSYTKEFQNYYEGK
ncbi:tRNA1(Val) (adenine(37)-N6)-methyltransferase [Thalassorhabdus alkalitolerans]|uniref:tRNA1(Val) (Adenine(37)-N6)-methyltransferase n=1 Tax=Thalassorhabdus alkalitolerans TaxID=2282697 RepID=A0ABW0YPL4_9BACI